MTKPSGLGAELSQLLAAEREPPRIPEAQRQALIERVLNASAQLSPTPVPWGKTRRVRSWPIAVVLAACLAGTVWAGQSGLWPGQRTSAPPRVVEKHAPQTGPGAVSLVPAPSSMPRALAAPEASVAIPGPSAASSFPALEVRDIATTPLPTAVSPAKRGNADIAEELATLERARAAQQRGDPAEALRSVQAHERRFPRSIFGEEREALHVSALGKLGRTTEARARARAFAHRFPRSVFISKLAPWLSE